MNFIKSDRLSGLLIAIGMIAGIFSIAPAVDSPAYLTEAAKHSGQVIAASIFQLLMSFCYLGVAILLYPLLTRHHRTLAIGFLNFRLVSVCLSLIGTLLLLSIIALSETVVQGGAEDAAQMGHLGYVLKSTRDYVNHVLMVTMLCIGNILMYSLMAKFKLLPGWLLVWGIVASILSIFASILILFKVTDVITTEYVALNVPTMIFEFVFGIWLLGKGLKDPISAHLSTAS